MRSFFSLLRLDFLPHSADFGLLVLRVWVGLSMLLLHGWSKLMAYKTMPKDFVTFFGLPSEANYALAVFAEVLCSALLVLGLFTRGAALALAITMGVAFFMAHEGRLSGENNGEMAFLYLMVYVVLFLAGPGRFSIDGAGNRGTGTSGKRY